MPAPSIMSPQIFLTSTKLGVFNSRKSLEPIDGILTNCVGLDAKPIDDRIALMVLLIEMGNKWLTSKAALVDANTAKRRAGVQQLMEQAQKRFAYERFTQKKQRSLAPGARPVATRGMQSGYRAERQQFLTQRADLQASGAYGRGVTVAPISGSYAHEMHGFARAGKSMGKDFVTRQAEFANFTLEDYQAYKATNVPGINKTHVHFMRKSERLHNMIIVTDGLLTHKGAKLTTAARDYIYVMDTYGNLFYQNALVDGPMAGDYASQYNHSSLNAGADVICAGMIEVKEGVLKLLSNESGHYAPSYLNLVECLKMLVTDGVDLTTTEVRIYTGADTFGPWKAEVFLANPESCLRHLAVVVVPEAAGPMVMPADVRGRR